MKIYMQVYMHTYAYAPVIYMYVCKYAYSDVCTFSCSYLLVKVAYVKI